MSASERAEFWPSVMHVQGLEIMAFKNKESPSKVGFQMKMPSKREHLRLQMDLESSEGPEGGPLLGKEG